MFERPNNRGKTPLYCCRSHRQRAYEARKAAWEAEQFVEIQDVVEFRDQLNKLERSGVVSSSFASLGRTVADSFTAGPGLGGISKMIADSFTAGPGLGGISKMIADSFTAGPGLGGISKMVADSFTAGPALGGVSKTVADSFTAGPALGGVSKTVADSFTAGPALGGISKTVADSLRFATSPALEGISKTVADSFKAFGPAMSLAPNPPLDELQLFMAESAADSLLARESLLRAGIPSATLDANAELDFEDLNDALLEVELERLIKDETGRFEEARASEDDLRVAGAGLCILILLASVHGTDLSSNLEDIVYDGFRQMWFLLHATGLAEQSAHVSGFIFWWCVIGGAANLIERKAQSTRP